MGYAMCGRSTLRENCANFLAWFWLNFAVDIFFIVDIVINFRTGYINEGFFVEDDYLAAMSYLRGAFLMDLLGSLPINIVIMIAQPENPFGNVIEGEQSVDVTRINRTLRMLRMMKILKLFRIRKLASYAQNFEDFINPAVISIAKLVIVMILCCHWFGASGGSSPRSRPTSRTTRPARAGTTASTRGASSRGSRPPTTSSA